MALTPGTHLGPYEVAGSLGAGGMGEVYRARDAKLGREVALKVLPEDVASDPERLKRFEREARTLAALNHPHIAQVYGFEDSGSVRALVMELVPGESLAARLARGPVPLREALDIARQVADGLEAAHERGIVHRDLKPANMQVTPEGVAKVLDFGLAKPVGPEVTGDGGEDAATITSPAQLTQHGLLLGTAAYMSPEQARGQAVDARTDVWAFGALLYELLSGMRAFPGPAITDTLAQVLERDPDWTKLPATTPSAIRALVRRCLQKDLRHRLHDIADAKFAIEDALAALSSGALDAAAATGVGAAIAAQEPPRAIWRHPLPLGLALLVATLAATLAWSVNRTPASAPREPQFLSLMLPPDQSTTLGLDVSRDGRAVVYAAVADEGPPGPMGDVQRLYYRRLAESDARALSGTESSTAPGFSPDGEWVAFLSRADGSLKKIAVRGGGPVVLATKVGGGMGSGSAGVVRWTADGHLLVPNQSGPLLRVPAAGGAAEPLIPRAALEPGEEGYTYPFPLPRPGDLLFTSGYSPPAVAAWVGGRRQALVKDAANPQRLGDHLLFWRRTSASQIDLSAVAFDASRVTLEGDPVPILSLPIPQGWYFAVSPSGTLAYRPAGVETSLRPSWHPLGEAAGRTGFGPSLPEGGGLAPRVSPDGRRVLMGRSVAFRGVEIAVHDLAAGTRRVVANGPAGSIWTTWSHDGRRVIYQAWPDAPGGAGLLWVPLDGSAPAERLTTSKSWQQPQIVTRDGRFLVYQETGGVGTRTDGASNNVDLWLLPLAPRGAPRPLLQTPANERLPHLSPDDRWMAYVSDESGGNEVWVRAFPEGGGAIRVSPEGGTGPLWAPDGRTLYYRDGAGSRLFAVPVTPGTPPQFGPATVTHGYWVQDGVGRNYDIAPDGTALLVLPGQRLGRELGIILNFDVLVQRKMAEATKGGATGSGGPQ